MEEQIHRWVKEDTIKVKLERGQRGTYGWEISYENTDDQVLIDRIERMDLTLRTKFAQSGEVEAKG